jgi:hypothetical protein
LSVRRARTVAAIVLFGGSLIAAIGGCAGIFGIDDLSSSAYDAGAPVDAFMPATDAFTPPVDAGVDAFLADTGTDTGCQLVGIPDPPANDSPSTGDVKFTVALDRIDLGIAPDAGGPAVPAGYNLDKFCTGSTGGNSCTTMTNGTAYSTYVVDKNADGVDNAGFNLIKYLTTLGSVFSPESINERLQDGQWSIVAVVGNYGGGPDDTSVTVDVFPAYGLSGAPGNMPVVFSPSDVWLIDQNAVVPGTQGSIYRSATAYVVGGKLVAQLPTLAFTISVADPNPRLTLALNEVYFSADIVPATGSTSAYRLTNGVLSGRWATQAFFDAVEPLTYNGSSVCSQSAVSGLLHTQVCSARDISANGANDNMGKACDAISVGMSFDSYAVDTTAKGTAPTFNVNCGDAGDCN